MSALLVKTTSFRSLLILFYYLKFNKHPGTIVYGNIYNSFKIHIMQHSFVYDKHNHTFKPDKKYFLSKTRHVFAQVSTVMPRLVMSFSQPFTEDTWKHPKYLGSTIMKRNIKIAGWSSGLDVCLLFWRSGILGSKLSGSIVCTQTQETQSQTLWGLQEKKWITWQ